MSRTSVTKTNAIRLLESAGISFTAYEYPVDDGRIDAKSIAEKIGRSQDEVFKTLVAESPAHEHFVFVVPAAGELDLKKAAHASGQKSIEKLFPTFIDETAILFDTICVSGGRVGLNLAIVPDVLREFIHAEFYDLTKS